MAISKERKEELVENYAEWLKRSQAVILADFRGQPTKDILDLRVKVRAAQGEFHVVKNSLLERALREANLPTPDKLLTGTTAAVFCFEDAPAAAKAVTQFASTAKFFSVKGVIMGKNVADAAGVKALAELPPRPMVLAQVLGTIQAPASKVAGVIHAGLRQVAAVVQARVDQLRAAEGAA